MTDIRRRRKILVFTGSRGEWGYVRPILRLIDKDPDLEYSIVATNMHLLPEFGMSVNEILNDGFDVDERIFMTFAGYTGATMAKSLGALLQELPTAFGRIRPDILLLSGDRGEQLAAALAGLHMGIPVAHIQAGELSGNVDGIVRHAITKLAHIHFTANAEFTRRVEKMGEQKHRIFEAGAPLVDELVHDEVTPKPDICRKFRLNPEAPFILAVQHPVTEEEDQAGSQVEETLHALLEKNWPTVMIYPNADAGSDLIRARLGQLKRPNIRLHRNLSRADYLGLMKSAACMVGNSSSGIMEAPSFGTPAVNIGRRQIGRPQADNVINTEYDRNKILSALERAVSDSFRKTARASSNPYGDGNSSSRIVEVLKTITIDDKLLNKEMTY